MVDYKQAGVDIDAGNEAVRRIRSLARGTFTPGVLSDIGSFGGLFQLGAGGASDPVLVASADGVGTKLKVAFLTGVHDTIGADLVNHCVNDILVQGAEPLFFLDYLATGRLDPDVAVKVVDGLAAGVPRERLRAARRRDRRDARLLRRRRVRPRRLHRRRRSGASAHRREAHRARRRADRPAVERAAHQRLFAGAPHRVRGRRPGAGRSRVASSGPRSARRCSRRTGRTCP